MSRLPASASLLALLLTGLYGHAAEPERYRLDIGADLSYLDVSGNPSWTSGSAGKLRYDDSTDGLSVSHAFADYRLRVFDTVDAHLAAELYDDDMGSIVDFSEAYVSWHPMTLTPNRLSLKLGAFYPRISLENSDPGWSSPYTISSSAINTWVGEELRAFGAEASVSRRPQFLGGAHTFSIHAAAFYKNDPAGTLISWKGWSIHDRHTRFNDEISLPAVPQIQPGMAFSLQDPYVAPFREIDDRVGYYIDGEWKISERFLFRAMHYDNRADPESYEDGQFGWRTRFDHIGLQVTLPGDIGLISQWMRGNTAWGWMFNGVRVVDADFHSDFLLLTKSIGQHRVSARFDRFDVWENDTFPLDDNSEDGHAWTLSYQYEFSEYLRLAAEWLQIETYRGAWEYFDFETSGTERQLQLSFRLGFGSGA